VNSSSSRRWFERANPRSAGKQIGTGRGSIREDRRFGGVLVKRKCRSEGKLSSLDEDSRRRKSHRREVRLRGKSLKGGEMLRAREWSIEELRRCAGIEEARVYGELRGVCLN